MNGGDVSRRRVLAGGAAAGGVLLTGCGQGGSYVPSSPQGLVVYMGYKLFLEPLVRNSLRYGVRAIAGGGARSGYAAGSRGAAAIRGSSIGSRLPDIAEQIVVELGSDYIEQNIDFDLISEVAFQRDSTESYNRINASITNLSNETIGLTTQIVGMDSTYGTDVWSSDFRSVSLKPGELWVHDPVADFIPQSGTLRFEMRTVYEALPSNMTLAEATGSSTSQLVHVLPMELQAI